MSEQSMEDHWRSRFEETAQNQEEDHALAIWSRFGLEMRQRLFLKVFRSTMRGPRRILDLGCGPGVYARTLAADHHRVVGLDFSIPTLKKAHKKAAAEGRTVSFTGGALYHLPFRDESFDCIVFIGVLQHISDEWKALREIHRVLKPGGVLFLMTRNILFRPNHKADKSGRLRSFHPYTLRQQISDLGYDKGRIDAVFLLRGRGRMFFPLLDRLHHVTPLTRPLLLAAEAFLLRAEKLP